MERSPARRRRATAFAPELTTDGRHGTSPRKPGRPMPPVPDDLVTDAERLGHERLAVAARLSVQLAPLQNEAAIAELAVAELHNAFQYYLAVIQRLDGPTLRVVAAAGPLVGQPGFLAFEQSVGVGVNGRVARTGSISLVPDTRLDPDYLGRHEATDPRSELSLPITVDGTVWGVMNLEQIAPEAFKADDVLLAEAICAQVGAALHRAALAAEVEATVTNTLGTLIDVLEAKDEYTAQHARDVVDLSERVARRLGLD
ncbi:MAG: GAF domain-containing protein, partial [Solirubrobacteraceae bacterium]|nr:GAF domain-containing protein [Solirubrobacteraceae bacterium]